MFPRLENRGMRRVGKMRTPGEVIVKRWQVLLVLAFAFGLVSRGVATPQPAGFTPSALSAEAIGTVVASANPDLSNAERRRIGRAVLRSSIDNGLDPQLVTAIILVESGARPWALSPKGAVGLMQVMPHMTEARMLAGNLTTIESNVAAGCSILADNIRRLGEDDGISAYFWGSDIRGVAYLDRVRAARATVRRLVES
jgi:soluble lytic murein transglycosylase-like protein